MTTHAIVISTLFDGLVGPVDATTMIIVFENFVKRSYVDIIGYDDSDEKLKGTVVSVECGF
jgi:hypothetical protein